MMYVAKLIHCFGFAENILCNMELPLVSILITSYNRAGYIQAAVESALNQTYGNTEIIIADNCSTDSTREILEQYEHHEKVSLYFNETNIGQFPNRNKVASLAKGEYLKYLDSDDLLYPYSVEIMVKAMEQFPEAGIGISYEISKNQFPFPFLLEPKASITLHFTKGLLFPGPGSIIYRTGVFRAFDGFEDYGLPSDNLLTLKIASLYKVVALPRDLYWWRRHDTQEFNQMAGNPKVHIQYFLINKKILEAESCPVAVAESRYFLLCHKIRLARNMIRHLLKGELKSYFYIKKHAGITVLDLLRSFLPVSFFK
jgi:glycosyltransferase involved in cell wall biosynthesis